MNDRKTLIIGASPNPERFSHRAIKSLVAHSFPVVAVGLRDGVVSGITIQKPFPDTDGIDTVSLYVGKIHQPFYYDFILKLAPRRVIFNPGTENKELESLLHAQGIETISDCTLVMLVNNDY